MARTAETAPRRRGIPFVRTIALSLWRLRQTWQLLLVSGLGVLAAVMLVCAVPLFSEVAMSAGLRDQLAQLDAGPPITFYGTDFGSGQAPSADLLTRAEPALNSIAQRELGSYLLPGAPEAFVTIFTGGNTSQTSGFGSQGVVMYGIDMHGDTSAYALTAGRLPAANSDDLELAIPQSAANRYALHVGDVQSFTFDSPDGPHTVNVTLVGILKNEIDLGDSQSFNRFGVLDGGSRSESQNDTALASADTLINTYGNLNGASAGLPLSFAWTYHLDLSRITVDSLGDLNTGLQNLNTRDSQDLYNATGLNVYESDSIQGTLVGYVFRVVIAQIPIGLMLIQVLGFALLFIGLMVSILVDRQADSIAVLRSRGASRSLVLRTLTVQSLGVGLLGLILGPLLALLLVQGVARIALPASDLGALNVLTNNPIAAAWGVRWFAFAAGICAIVAMIVSTRRAANSNVLALRRESARTRGRPIWQRLNLDLIFAAFAILGYAAYNYIISNVGGQARPFLSVLSLFAMLFFLLAVVMLFLRFFPLLLRILARFASRGNKAAPMLAISQMARSPRQASRMTLLLALSTAFTLFALIFAATQAQRSTDVATYTTGSDFRGTISPATSGIAAMNQLTTSYSAIPGVTSATPVYEKSLFGDQAQVELLAVNADTFSQTAIWTSQDADQSLTSLMATLSSQRNSTGSAVPAIVDDALWTSLNLTQGTSFTLVTDSNTGARTRFIAAAHVAHIPPVNDGSDALRGNGSPAMLVDFATYVAVADSTATPNSLWLRTRDDAASLASVRAALTSGSLAVRGLLDRRQAIENSNRDPLRIDLLSVLAIAAGTALLLALVGILLGSWLSARTRLTSFALLRALGSEPGQLASVLLWEQGIVYALALGLGIVLGFILAIAVLPVIVFTNGAIDEVISTLDTPPVQAIIPWPTIGIVIGGLILICGSAILLMTRIVARPSISQTLRLNED